ncbi:MAG: manganese efflux pump [Elusimicrobia bacterium]|nr:manganese efflux pump [Elusimicrobiota bacterium]
MSLLTVISIALGLSMDALAVSITSGIAIRDLRPGHALKIALFFGGFQAVMPVLGWLAGLSMRGFISGVDHWVAFGLLLFVGGKMIRESFSMREGAPKDDPLDDTVLLMLAVATSIDALAVGITFSFLSVSIALPVVVIGAVTFALSFAGVLLGKRVGHVFESRIEAAGGLILIGIGCKILFDHLTR